jgi:Polyketide cyclase / dehydrase and lipid transport
MKTMSATVQIHATPEAVWAVLTDLGRYPEWNPLFREASGQVAAGNRLTLRSVHPANGQVTHSRPMTPAPGRRSGRQEPRAMTRPPSGRQSTRFCILPES